MTPKTFAVLTYFDETQTVFFQHSQHIFDWLFEEIDERCQKNLFQNQVLFFNILCDGYSIGEFSFVRGEFSKTNISSNSHTPHQYQEYLHNLFEELAIKYQDFLIIKKLSS